jgi:hypothetical protein
MTRPSFDNLFSDFVGFIQWDGFCWSYTLGTVYSYFKCPKTEFHLKKNSFDLEISSLQKIEVKPNYPTWLYSLKAQKHLSIFYLLMLERSDLVIQGVTQNSHNSSHIWKTVVCEQSQKSFLRITM